MINPDANHVYADEQFEIEAGEILMAKPVSQVMTNSEFQMRRENARLLREIARLQDERHVQVHMGSTESGQQQAITQTVIVQKEEVNVAEVFAGLVVFVGIIFAVVGMLLILS